MHFTRFVLSCSLAAAVLAACGGTATPPAPPSSAPAAPASKPVASASAKPAASASAPAAVSVSPSAAGSAAAKPAAAPDASGKVIASAAGSGPKVRAGLSVATTFDYLPGYAGIDWGTYKAAGVDVELSTFNGDAFLAQAMAAGSEDIGMHSAVGVSNAIAKGSPVKIVAQLNASPAFMGVIAGPDVRTVDDLKGKAVGCTSAGAFTCFLIAKLSQSKGWNGNDALKPTFLGGFDTELAGLKTKQVAAFIWTHDQGTQVEGDKSGKWLMDFGALLPQFPFETIAAQEKFIQSNPDALRKFLEGYFKAQAMLFQDAARTKELAKKYIGLGPDAVQASLDADKSILSPDGRIDDKGMANVADGLVELKLTPERIDPTKLYTTQFTPVKV
ncbi:MAG TPA: ABC transporter substrate-binding protein [Chloroflexota bacterium]|nr:ABC transporter substrate-binding protein [Chloroflexota bacterium]